MASRTPRRLVLNLPPDRPPKGSPERVDLLVRQTAAPGDVIELRVIRRRTSRALAEVPIEMQDMKGRRIAIAASDAEGIARFVAPEVGQPEDVLFEPSGPKVTTYIDRSDRRARAFGFVHGVHQIAFTTVLPPLQVAPLPVANPPRFEVSQGVGWWDGTSFPALIEKARRKGWIADDSWWSTKGGMEEEFGHKGPADMWTFFGHSMLDPATGRTGGLRAWRPFAVLRKGEPVTIADLCAAARAGQGPPGFVVLGGCATEGLLDELIACCVKVAVGVTALISPPIMQRALNIFWEHLLDGDPFGQALDAANGYLDGNMWNTTGARLTFKAKAHLPRVRGMLLDEIRSAPRAPEADGRQQPDTRGTPTVRRAR